ncbi:phage/plasmid-like protein (TIGR03299 family) [Saccharopolyspora lacisalsi]|uniref:Phage/plasmid-like protein (TIGR03299 family) n=1 Tax=Halosaccharopolyspora lacisalsi TaxID=1000566 RepID=A0A839DWS2_9PSEU|nr:DUF932 domain-containing protein [Halosaccharopolyspora lacisalsi]MBA8823897.1 phage/plasmid-like protein (TIGR03299 family) [Halosaccharopolyspora lacisalsi]
MAHHIERFTDGSAAFASARLDAWHRLGTVTRACMTGAEVMSAARLGGWNVRKLAQSGTELTPDGVSTVDNPEKFMTVRTHPVTGQPDYLGTVGTEYVVRQNEEQVELLDALVDESEAHFETAGSLRGGRETFVTMKLPQTMRLAGTDSVDFYIVALNSHDGSSAFRVLVSPVRVVCANTQHMALRHAQASYSIRHTKNSRFRIAEVRSKLGLMWQYCEAFEVEAERMIQAELSTAQFRDTIDRLWPFDGNTASPRTRSNHERRTGELMRLWTNAETQASIRGTRWAGLQAVTEYLDHHSPAKDADVRANRVLTSTTLAGKKQHAHQLLSV